MFTVVISWADVKATSMHSFAIPWGFNPCNEVSANDRDFLSRALIEAPLKTSIERLFVIRSRFLCGSMVNEMGIDLAWILS